MTTKPQCEDIGPKIFWGVILAAILGWFVWHSYTHPEELKHQPTTPAEPDDFMNPANPISPYNW